MPRSLLEGYMAGKRYLQEREEREEQGKREKLEDQLRELKFKGLTRQLEMSAQEWEQTKKGYQQGEEAILQLPEEQQPYARLGLRLPQKEKGPTVPWWVGTEHEKPYIRKQTQIAGPTLRSVNDRDTAQAYSKIPEEQRTPFQKKFLKKYFEGTRAGKTYQYSSDPEDEAILQEIFGGGGGTGGGVTQEENEFIEEARGKKVDWDAVAKKHPNWNLFYIKQKLGVNE